MYYIYINKLEFCASSWISTKVILNIVSCVVFFFIRISVHRVVCKKRRRCNRLEKLRSDSWHYRFNKLLRKEINEGREKEHEGKELGNKEKEKQGYWVVK